MLKVRTCKLDRFRCKIVILQMLICINCKVCLFFSDVVRCKEATFVKSTVVKLREFWHARIWKIYGLYRDIRSVLIAPTAIYSHHDLALTDRNAPKRNWTERKQRKQIGHRYRNRQQQQQQQTPTPHTPTPPQKKKKKKKKNESVLNGPYTGVWKDRIG